MFGAKVRDHLGDFRVGEGVAKGRHFLAAIENLGSDFGRGPELVLAQAGQVRSFFAAAAARAVAVGAALALKQNRACLFVGIPCPATGGVGREGCQEQNGRQQGEAIQARDHVSYFRISEGCRASFFGLCPAACVTCRDKQIRPRWDGCPRRGRS